MQPPHDLQLDFGHKVEYVRTAGGSIRIFADTLWRSSGHEAPAGVRSNEASAGSHA